MGWTCQACGGDNDVDDLRCACGLELEAMAVKPKTEVEVAREKAQAARDSGISLYQLMLPLSSTRGAVVPMMGVFTASEITEHSSILSSVEECGWRLEHVNYVYRITEIVSRDKLLSSGQQEAVSGDLLGIYIFRRAADNEGDNEGR